MRIKNKYLRNRAYRAKHWNRIRSQSHPFITFVPCTILGYATWTDRWTYENQVKRHFEDIAKEARAIENGGHSGRNHAPKCYRKVLNDKRKAKERNFLNKIRQGNYDAEIPKFRKDADWLYF